MRWALFLWTVWGHVIVMSIYARRSSRIDLLPPTEAQPFIVPAGGGYRNPGSAETVAVRPSPT